MKRLCIAVCVMTVVFCCGCRRAAAPKRTPSPRIISFAPSITQMVFDMGLGDHVVGVTSQCDLPGGQARPVVGDALSVNVEAILAAEPDVLLAQMGPDNFEALRKMAPGIVIEHFKIETLADIASALERIGAVAGRPEKGRAARAGFEAALGEVRRSVAACPRPRVMFVYGFERPSTAGAGTFIGDMIDAAGGTNIAAETYTGWKNVNLEQIIVAAPDVLICQSDHAAAQTAARFWGGLADIPAARSGRVHIVTDRRWTIPSTYSAVLVGELAEMIHGAPGPQE